MAALTPLIELGVNGALKHFDVALVRRSSLQAERDAASAAREAAYAERDQYLRERNEGIERSKLWEEETYRTRAQLLPIEQQLLRTYESPLLPPSLLALCKHFDALPKENRESFSRHVMTRATYEPEHFRFIEGTRGEHPLALQTEAAVAFAKADPEKAAEILFDLTQGYPEDFNFLCLARTLEAMDKDDEAAEILKKRLVNKDLFITMELATIYARHSRVDDANFLLDTMREHFTEEQQALKPLQVEIDAAVRSKALEKKVSDDIYTDEFVIDNWWFYWRTYNSFNEYQHGNVSLDTGIRNVVRNLLKTTLSRTRTFIDFGAFCGFTIAKLAEEFPSIRFIGVDRPLVAKALNDKWFTSSNLEFHADDILGFLDALGPSADTVLFHSRTACFCYPEFLVKLYEQCRRLNIKDILMQEGTSAFSRAQLRFYELGKFPTISVAGRGSTFLHDYPVILQRAGFHVSSNVPIRPKILLDDRSGFGAHHSVLHAAAN